jgi:hypothetical protein
MSPLSAQLSIDLVFACFLPYLVKMLHFLMPKIGFFVKLLNRFYFPKFMLTFFGLAYYFSL